MAKDFGNTWWGREWLRSLDNIDHDNRLPRGASYARRGMVKDIKIKENAITAKVAGSRPRPYRVDIIVPPFFDDDIERLMTEIIRRPTIISKLLNRELDPDILAIAEKLKLKVFPRQWIDFKMNCSCPDWAVPCKHLAAVIYMVSREIDNNPFVVFDIHKVNLLAELNKRGIHIETKSSMEIPRYKDFLKREAAKSLKTDPYTKVNFTTLEPIGDSIIQILADNPPFCTAGNFKESYAKELSGAVKVAAKFIRKGDETLFPTAIKTPISHCDTFSITVNGDASWEVGREVDEWLSALIAINPDRILDYEPSVASLHQLLISSVHLLANGAVIPQIVELDRGGYAVRWLPATIDERVARIMEQLDQSLPAKLIVPAARETALLNQAELIVSLFLTALIDNVARVIHFDLGDMFFHRSALTFKGVGESETAGGIKAWLDRYYIARRDSQIIVAVAEVEDKFEVSIAIDNPNKGLEELPLAELLTNGAYSTMLYEVLQPLSLLSSFIKGLDEYINSGAGEPIALDSVAFVPFLIDIIPAIKLLNIKVILPKSLEHLLRPHPTVRLKSKSKDGKGFVNLLDVLSFDWQIAVGDDVISVDEYQKLLDKASRLIKFKGNYLYVSDEDLAKIHKQLTSTKEMSPYKMLQAALSEEFDGAPIVLSDEVRDLIKQFTTHEVIPLPAGIKATLRPYQERGFSWLYRNLRIGFGSVLADDMGLGKTLQVITLLLKLKEEEAINLKHRAVIITPTGLLTNWLREINRFAPSLTAEIYHGTQRDFDKLESEIIITTYGTVRSEVDFLKKRKWQAVVIDEAQNIKNTETAQTKAVKALGAPLKIAMSGTPVENRLSEFWSIMDFSNKGYLGNLKTFKDEYATPIQVFNDEQAVSRFKRITAPFMMRRLKSDKSIITDLPDKIEQNCFATLTTQQAAIYEKTLAEAMNAIEEYSETGNESLFKRQGLILQMILALKQICNHPAQFLKNGATDASLSGKAMMLLDLVENIVDSNEKVLIFTQFREMGELLKKLIAERTGSEPMFYHGGSSLKEREDMVHRFQNSRSDKVFILSLKAAGTGLNLTAATHVIHYDLWWNPAVEAQATDRAYRIGQHKNVQVHRFITQSTFEEKIDEMIQSKRNLAEMTVATGENWLGNLSNKELRDIFG
ncbi:MAG: SNF2-related protein [Bacteroidales bacterium]